MDFDRFYEFCVPFEQTGPGLITRLKTGTVLESTVGSKRETIESDDMEVLS